MLTVDFESLDITMSDIDIDGDGNSFNFLPDLELLLNLGGPFDNKRAYDIVNNADCDELITLYKKEFLKGYTEWVMETKGCV